MQKHLVGVKIEGVIFSLVWMKIVKSLKVLMVKNLAHFITLVKELLI